MSEIRDKIMTMGMEETYMWLVSCGQAPESILKRMRFGIYIRMDIHDFFQGNFGEKAKANMIIYGNRRIMREDINTEMEERMKLGKRWLLENLDKPFPVAPRGLA